jgi:hypothetical protein
MKTYNVVGLILFLIVLGGTIAGMVIPIKKTVDNHVSVKCYVSRNIIELKGCQIIDQAGFSTGNGIYTGQVYRYYDTPNQRYYFIDDFNPPYCGNSIDTLNSTMPEYGSFVTLYYFKNAPRWLTDRSFSPEYIMIALGVLFLGLIVTGVILCGMDYSRRNERKPVQYTPFPGPSGDFL